MVIKVDLQYIFKVVILLNTVLNLKISFKPKIDPEVCTFKNMEEISQKSVATLKVMKFRLYKKNKYLIKYQYCIFSMLLYY